VIEPAPLPPLDRVAAIVAAETGMVFADAAGHERLAHAVRRAMARAGAGGDDYLARLAALPALLDDLVDELAVGETYFFRHPDQFRFLADVILPERLAAKPAGPLLVWSAGCSSGEEPYSLAMAFAERGLLPRVRILATDVSPAALARAREARYRSWSLRGPGAERALPYLRRDGPDLVVIPAIRDAVAFRRTNVAAPGDDGPRGLDMVLCRNVLIYLDRAAVTRAAARLHAALDPGGWLVAGPSEPLLAALAPFEVVTTAAGVYYRRSATALPRPPAPPARAPRARASADPVRPSAAREPPAATERAAAGDAAGAEDPVAAALARGAALLEAGRDAEAATALRRLVYLDPTLAIGHFLLGEALRRQGDRSGARRAFEAAGRIAGSLPPGATLRHGEGERAGRLADAAAAAADRLGAAG
jgi:chemotaxis protein methyltransferase CheR